MVIATNNLDIFYRWMGRFGLAGVDTAWCAIGNTYIITTRETLTNEINRRNEKLE